MIRNNLINSFLIFLSFCTFGLILAAVTPVEKEFEVVGYDEKEGIARIVESKVQTKKAISKTPIVFIIVIFSFFGALTFYLDQKIKDTKACKKV